ncbi:hypothetical protein HanXRQr2_Chr09g0391251 [Helianthus annuus]|uniref:Uncharacterized protein n=1 Tax=Helianthus annuus TaxID=4232 RepID=A0A9K3I613_HELAN|nr:hypothetical protein HanXRQr2_Chr09g0391251 [Helianthus annuus]KAJ0959180.1 hypothetical protein HanPSC8_Chr00c342g0807921 [Helianthus annuus]
MISSEHAHCNFINLKNDSGDDLCSRVSFNRGRGGKREENMTIYSSSQIGEIMRENFPSPPPLK